MGDSRVCETVTAATTAELRARRDAVVLADLVELRLDGLKDPDARAALEGRRLPAIVTCRPVWDGGRFDGSEEERCRLLGDALEAGAEYVDVEWLAGFRTLLEQSARRRLVLSLHDFRGVPETLPSLYRAMRQTGAGVVKVAVTARRLCDAFSLETAAHDALGAGPQGGQPHSVFVAMGARGVATRILPARFRSQWSYAGTAAPGQLSAERLVREFRFREVSASTAVYGVAGARASDSLSPLLHNAAFRAAGVDAVYVPLQADDFGDLLEFADRLPVTGLSVTMPFKEAAMRQCAELDEAARAAGAVNTLRRTSAGWCGTNTDIDGFLDPIRDVSLHGRRVAILGAGGAARAVASAAARCGALVSVFARNRQRAERVAALANGRAFDGVPEPGDWDVLINATPVGSVPDVDQTPYPAFGGEATRWVGPAMASRAAPTGVGERLVYDLVYRPAVTRLLREARVAGCRTVGGLEMLVAQARRQHAWWTGRRVEERVMRDALSEQQGTSR